MHTQASSDWKTILTDMKLQEQRARSSALQEKPLHDLHHAVRLHLLSHRGARDESYGRARKKRIARLFRAQGIETFSPGRPDRDRERRARLKLEQIEDHQGFMNQFRFEPLRQRT